MSEGNNILETIATNTVMVLIDLPEKRDEWRSGIEQIRSRARELDDASMLALLDAVEGLLAGERPDALDPGLEGPFAEGPYAECWAAIRQRLKQGTDRIRAALERSTRPYDKASRAALCRRALQLVSREEEPVKWAVLHGEAANSLFDAQRENTSEEIEGAIHHFEQVFEVATFEDYPIAWALNHHNLGNAYTQRIAGDRAENLEQAIQRYEECLRFYTHEAQPENWATTQNNLAIAYRERIRGERAENLERSIEHCQKALEVHTRESFPRQWASIQTNLGNAFEQRIRGSRAENLEGAIHHYTQAVNVIDRQADPYGWASIQNNLGTAYRERIRGERAENVEQAIACYRRALKVRTPEATPADWAMTQSNLGGAYSERVRGSHAENVERAIEHYSQALEAYTRDAFPERWALVQYNLADAFLTRLMGERGENVERAIEHAAGALEVYTRDAFPERWAYIQNILAIAHAGRAEGDRAENVERAIEHYRRALEVRTRDAFPQQWAITLNNLGRTYRDRIKGERAENVEQAITHFREALEVLTLDRFPADRRRALRNLGDLTFDEQRWEDALAACEGAIEAGDALLAAAYTEAGRQAEVGETARLFAQAAYCQLQTGDPAGALLTLERGKTRLLAEALSLGDADLDILPDARQQAMRDARAAVRELEAEMRAPSDAPARRDDRELADLLRQARAALYELVEEIRAGHPDFMPTGLEVPGILELIPEGGALVAPVITSQGSAAFIVPGGEQTIEAGHVLRLDDFTTADLHALLTGSEDNPGWRRVYSAFRAGRVRLPAWQEAIERFTGQLWDGLVGPIHERLAALGVGRVLLMPQGGLQLLPLHAAWRIEEGAKRYLIDDYRVSHAPSAYTLQVCRRRAQERHGDKALVAGIEVYERLPPLFNACAEAEAIAAAFDTQPLLDADATRQAVVAGLADSAYLHLSCHGSFAWGRDPLASALYLAGDEPLSLGEILALDMDAIRLVTLSACETGITDVRESPDEYVGLPSGFLQAGAPGVVSSLWTVDDESTRLLMERFYRNHLEERMDFAAALREAQIWLRDQAGEGRHASPFYWAAFTYTGA
jgi:CHAT domain-containing protein